MKIIRKRKELKEEVESSKILELRKVYHYYEKARSLEEVNLGLEKQALEAVIGPNGAGKTTLLRSISGLEEIDRGKILFKGKRIDDTDAYKIARMGIAQCPERRKLFYEMSVLENLQMGAYYLKDRKRFDELLDFVYEMFPRLKERKRQRADTLSGGEQQMLALGRAIMSNPELLLLDEPSLGLAPRFKKIIFQAINQIKETGTTTLLVEQDAALALDTAEYIHVLEEGKIEMRGTKEELEKEPRIKKVYLGI
ncbi:MAG: ABC transporter ATP-binding protein [Promethearchaeota archaeon]